MDKVRGKESLGMLEVFDAARHAQRIAHAQLIP